VTEAEALATPGDVRRHKKGGIYRVLEVTTIRDSRYIWAGNEEYDKPRHGRSVKPELLTTYEHLWPYEPAIYQRPFLEFEEAGRFEKVVHLHG
jgi:hypothetical protein